VIRIALVLLAACSYKGPVAHGEPCDGTCQAPASCITVVGQMPPARKECWITCGDHECPSGLTCTMIHDGPGKVCVKPE